jgi:purine nucleosidase
MREWKIPECKKKRVIIDTDAKNEVDDQFAIAQAVLSQSLDIRGIVAAHFGIS